MEGIDFNIRRPMHMMLAGKDWYKAAFTYFSFRSLLQLPIYFIPRMILKVSQPFQIEVDESKLLYNDCPI